MPNKVTSGSETAAATGAAEQSRRLLEESFNTGNFDLIHQLVAPETQTHDPAQPASLRSLRGPQVLCDNIEMYRSAFPDVQIFVDDVIESGDKVALRWHAEGTHRGELQGLSPTGAHVSVTGITIDHWREGKIVESWAQWDNLGLARQLGAAPPEGSAVEKVGFAIHRLLAPRMRKKNQ